jgi:hypothetical protein
MTGQTLSDLDVRRADREARRLYEREIREALRPKRCRCIGRPMVERDELLGTTHCVKCGHELGGRR